jgi:hypothetical protein
MKENRNPTLQGHAYDEVIHAQIMGKALGPHDGSSPKIDEESPDYLYSSETASIGSTFRSGESNQKDIEQVKK